MIATAYHIDNNNLLDLSNIRAEHLGMLDAVVLDRAPAPAQGAPKNVMAPTRKARIDSIDLLRGAVIVIMALDHVRDYFNADAFLYDPADLARTTAALFVTRWITHYCAPVFVLLAGLAACLHGSRRSPRELSIFLATRGAWL